MESEFSSESSFDLTDTTSSDSVDSYPMAVDNFSNKISNKELNNHHKKKWRKKTTVSNDDVQDSDTKMDIKEELQQAQFATKHKRKVKLEPESDYDVPKKKKKTKHDSNDIISQDPYDETHLHLKVKEEESGSSKQKRKKLCSNSHTDTNEEYVKENDSSVKYQDDSESRSSKSNKKKKKAKKHYDSDNNNLETEGNMGEESDTKVQEYSNKINNKYDVSSLPANNTLEEESEESGYEISAIKCVDDQNPHTLSFTNESKEKSDYENKKLRTPRISDRIQFEDEDDTNIESSQIYENDFEDSKPSTRLKLFVQTKPSLKLLPQKFHSHSSFTLDDEIWILKCPKEVEINAFNGANLNIHGKCKAKVGGQTYDANIEEEQADTLAVLSMEQCKYQIKNLPLNGIINLRKRIPKAHFHDDNVMLNNQTNFIPLPETKCRHPLFGSNYKKALKIPAAIAERLNAQHSEVPSVKTEKRKKKKKNKDRERNISEGETVAQSNTNIKLEVNDISEKKKRKRNRAEVDDPGPAPKKVKRIKHDPGSAEAWESEKAIEENLFNF